MKKRFILAITGASGSPYAKRLFDLLTGTGAKIDLILSDTGKRIWTSETGLPLSYFSDRGAVVHRDADIFSPMASGSTPWDGMVIIPASMGTMGRIAGGISDSLITRAADVTLKEKRKLIIVCRETPLSGIHLENMLRLDRCGATVLPASPAFYQKPACIDDLIDFVVARVLDQLGIAQTLVSAWEGNYPGYLCEITGVES